MSTHCDCDSETPIKPIRQKRPKPSKVYSKVHSISSSDESWVASEVKKLRFLDVSPEFETFSNSMATEGNMQCSTLCERPTHAVNGSVTLEDIMKQVCANGRVLAEVRAEVQELKGDIHDLQVENERLREEVQVLKKRERELREKVTEAQYATALAVNHSNEANQYNRRNNLRIYGLSEKTGDEDEEELETRVLELFQSMGVKDIRSEDVEAVHRLRRPKAAKSDSPRGVIVRFISRKHRDRVIKNRKQLKGSKTVIVEDLTDMNYQLLQKVKDSDQCKQAWTAYGKVYMKTHKDRIIHVASMAKLATHVE